MTVSLEYVFDIGKDAGRPLGGLSGPTAGGSIVFDSTGVHQAGITVPGAGEGSDQATITWGGGDHPADPTAVPPGLDFGQPSHTDPTTTVHMPEPYQPTLVPDDAPPEEPGDYPQPDLGEGMA
jgi:hypothetical protein